MTEISIRPIAPGDHGQWLLLWEGYNAFYGRSGATALDPEITATTWQRFFDAYEPMHALVAEMDGQVVGMTHFLFHRSTVSITPYCYLQDLFTAETARGKGVGRALIEGVYARAEADGANRVYWMTHEGNAPARLLYDTLAECPGFLIYRHML